jgi:type IV pilus assembly protein PilW
MKQIRRVPRLRPYRGQRGFSLIELIVAMVIAVFLLAGLFTVLQGNMDTSSEQTSLALLQDNERLAMQMFTNVIESAGYFPTVAVGQTGVNVLDNALGVDGSLAAGQAVTAGPNTSGGDSITARYQTNPNDGVSSCLGRTNTTGSTQIFKNILQVDTTQNALTCSDGNGVTAVPIVGGITNLTILLGVNTQATVTNANCPANTYVTTTQYATLTATQQTSVCTVQVTLTFVNPLYQPIPGAPPTPGQPSTVKFTKVIAIMAKTGPQVT